MNKFYVGHEVILRKNYINHAFAHDLIGCNFRKDYYISKKVVLLNREQDGIYVYHGTCIVANVSLIDPNDFTSSCDVLSCNDCHLAHTVSNSDCDLMPAQEDKFIGVVDIHPLSSFTNTKPDEIDLALLLVKEYNENVEEDSEYVMVNDDNYVKVISKIDEGFSKTKIKS